MRSVEALFLRYHDDLLAWVGVRYGHDLAEDVVATVFLKLLRGHLPDPERDPWPWLRTIARNAAIDHLRARASLVPLDDNADAPVTEFTDLVLLRIELDRALATLSELERDALTASSTGFTTEEIGRVHGRSEQAVKSVAKRIRRRLRAVLDPALLPALGGLAWLRRRARGLNVQNGALQGDAALFLSVAVVVGMVGGIAPSHPSDDARATSAPVQARFDARADQAQERDAAQRVRSVSPPEAGGSPLAPEPEAVEVDVHQRDGAATPDRIVVQEPTVDTPLGPVGGGRTEAECAGPGFDILPRSDSLYRMC